MSNSQSPLTEHKYWVVHVSPTSETSAVTWRSVNVVLVNITFNRSSFCLQGGLEFLARSSTLCSPYYKIRPSTLPSHLPSVQMMAVDILPASIPLDASQHFSKALAPYLRSLIDTYVSPDTSSARSSIRALETATIAVNGKLVEKHEWLQGAVDRWRTDNVRMVSSDSSGPLANKAVSTAEEALINPSPPLRKKRILMLGSGMVAGPAVDEIAKRADVQLVIGTYCLSSSQDTNHCDLYSPQQVTRRQKSRKCLETT